MDNLRETLNITPKDSLDSWFNQRIKPNEDDCLKIFQNLGIETLTQLSYQDWIDSKVFISNVYIDKLLADKVFYWLMREHITTGQYRKYDRIELMCRTFVLSYAPSRAVYNIHYKLPAALYIKNAKHLHYSIKQIDEFKATPCMLKLCFILFKKYPDLIKHVKWFNNHARYAEYMLGEHPKDKPKEFDEDAWHDKSWCSFVRDMKDSSPDGLFYLSDGVYL